MTSSHITCIRLRFLVIGSWFRASPRASTRGQFTKCHKHLMQWGIMGVRMIFLPSDNRLPSLINQLDVTKGEVLVTLRVWVEPTVPRIHPFRAFFVLAFHTAAMLSVCEGPWYNCIFMYVWAFGKNSSRSVHQELHLSNLTLKESQLRFCWNWRNKHICQAAHSHTEQSAALKWLHDIEHVCWEQ